MSWIWFFNIDDVFLYKWIFKKNWCKKSLRVKLKSFDVLVG